MAGSSVETSSEDVILQVIGQQMALYPRGSSGNQTEVRVIQIPTTMKPEAVNRSCVASWPGTAPADRVSLATDPRKIFDIRTSTFNAISGISTGGSIQSTTIGEKSPSDICSMESLDTCDSVPFETTRRLVTVVLSDKLPEVRISQDEEMTARLAMQRLEINDGVISETSSYHQKLREVSAAGSMVTLSVPSPFDLLVDERRRPPLFLFTSN